MLDILLFILLFLDFCSAVDTIHLIILANTMSHFHLNPGLVKTGVGFFFFFLTLVVSENRVFSPRSSCRPARSPAGCVLSPLLNILYTNDCRDENDDSHLL